MTKRADLSALIAIAAPMPAAADGLGGLAAAAFLMFILSAPLAVLGILMAFLLRAFDKKRAALIVGGLNAAICVIFLVFARDIQRGSFFDAFNPWLGSDNAIIVSICLLLIVGNLMFFVRSFAGRMAIVAGLLVFLGIQGIGAVGQ